MAERSKAADCKSAGLCPTKVRILLSPPVQASDVRRRASDLAPEAWRLRPGGSNSGVESQPSKLLVAGSNPVSRSSSLAVGCWPFADHFGQRRTVNGERIALV